MFADILFYVGLLDSMGISFLYFRDLGDVSQMVLKVKREDTIRFPKRAIAWTARQMLWFWKTTIMPRPS